MPDTIEANGHRVDPLAIRQPMIAWGKTHFRPFPWRLTTDPYQILIAELMLHRTQVAQVEPVYVRFMLQFPDLGTLSAAGKDDLHEALYSLGLRWRVGAMYEMVQTLSTRHAGIIPHEKRTLLDLPGVSEYVASALRCFAWNLPEPLLDTNTVRVIGRIFDLKVTDSSRRSRRFRDLLAALVDPSDPRAFNYALLDHAHLICLKRRPPLCLECPIKGHCVYGIRFLERKH